MMPRFSIFSDAAPYRRLLLGCIVFVCMGLIVGLLGQAASAQNIDLGNFSCTNGKASGNLFSGDTVSSYNAPDASSPIANGDPSKAGGPCAGVQGFFARLLCFFKSTVGQIMSSMYCGFQDTLRGPLSVALTLYVVVFGILIATGMSNFTPKEAIVTFFKIALIWGFAMHADLGIGIAYKFFISVAEGGSAMVRAALTSGSNESSLTQADTLLLTFSNALSGNAVGGNTCTVGGVNGTLISGACIPNACTAALLSLLIYLLFLLPIVGIFIIVMIILYIGLYARALLGYLTALVLISFLFVMAPLFLSFALFRTTMPLFEQWIKYLITYSLQMVIVFAFLAMLQLVPLGDFFVTLLSLLREYDFTVSVKWFTTFSFHMCSICDYTIDHAHNTIACLTGNPNPGSVMSTDGKTPVIPLLSMLKHQDFLVFVVAQVIALWILGHVMQDFLKKAPDLAKQLGDLPYAAALGGSPSGVQGPQVNFIGLESIEAGYVGFKNQFLRNPLSSHRSWMERLDEALYGEKKYETDEAGEFVLDKKGNKILARVRRTGLFDSILHGTDDVSGADAQEREAKIQRAARRTAAMNEKYVEAAKSTKRDKAEMETALTEVESLKKSNANPAEIDDATQRLKVAHKNYILAIENETNRKEKLMEEYAAQQLLEMQRTPLRGILASKDVHEGSIMEGLFGHAKDDDALQELSRMRQERQEKEAYGKVLKKGGLLGEDMVGFLNVGAATEEVLPIAELRSAAGERISSLETQLASARHFLPPDQVRQIEEMLSAANGNQKSARTAQDMQSVLKEIEDIQRALSSAH